MTKTQSKTKVSSAAKTSPSASKGLVQKKELKKSASDKGRVQLSARKPEKSPAKKSAAQAGKVAAKGATKAVAKPAAKSSGNNKIVSTLKTLLGGSKAPKKGAESEKAAPSKSSPKKVEAKKIEAKKPELKSAAKAAPSAPAKPTAGATGAAQAASGKGSPAKASPVSSAAPSEKGAPKAVAAPVMTKTGKPVKKAVAKAGSGLTAHGLGDSCREVACENMATTGPYCRMHYIKNWRRIKNKEKILSENRLIGFIEELVSKYPEKYIEAIRGDLASEKEFAKVISDLDLDESVDDFEGEGGENVENIIDTIRRDFDEDGEGF